MPTQIIEIECPREASIDSPLYVDANFPICYSLPNHPKYPPARDLYFELRARSVELYISTLTLDEMWWNLLQEWYQYDNNTQQLNARMLKRNPRILVKYRCRLERATANMLRLENATFLGDGFVGARSAIGRALNSLANENLTPRDSFHLALATLSNAAGIITCDPDFDNLILPGRNLKIYKY